MPSHCHLELNLTHECSCTEGPTIRARSKFALTLADEREAKDLTRKDMEKGTNQAEVSHSEQV